MMDSLASSIISMAIDIAQKHPVRPAPNEPWTTIGCIMRIQLLTMLFTLANAHPRIGHTVMVMLGSQY